MPTFGGLDDLATQTTMAIYRNEVSTEEFQNKVQKKSILCIEVSVH